MSNAPRCYNSNVCSLPCGATRTWTEHGCLNIKRAESWRWQLSSTLAARNSPDTCVFFRHHPRSQSQPAFSLLGEFKEKKEKRNERTSWKFHKGRVIKAARWIIQVSIKHMLGFIAPQGSVVVFYDFLCFCVSAINMSPSRLWISCMYIYLLREIRISRCGFRCGQIQTFCLHTRTYKNSRRYLHLSEFLFSNVANESLSEFGIPFPLKYGGEKMVK